MITMLSLRDEVTKNLVVKKKEEDLVTQISSSPNSPSPYNSVPLHENQTISLRAGTMYYAVPMYHIIITCIIMALFVPDMSSVAICFPGILKIVRNTLNN